jgi:ribosome-binding factor A
LSKSVSGPSRQGSGDGGDVAKRGKPRGGASRPDARDGSGRQNARDGAKRQEPRDAAGHKPPHGSAARRKPVAGPTQRQLRIAEEIRHVLAGVFARHEIRDPELADADITVTEVRIGPDLKHAIAFVARLGREDIDALLPALKRAAPFLRSQVAHLVQLKFAPDLSFQPDRALDYASKIDRLLHSPKVAQDLG